MDGDLCFVTYPKVNIFLKITGTRNEYHTLLSRFMLVKEIHDTLTFREGNATEKFAIQGAFDSPLESNTLYKATQLLQEHIHSQEIESFIRTHTLHVDKKVPTFAGLGGGSSNAAGLLHFYNTTFSLGLTLQELTSIGIKIGADLPFFLSQCESANVSGIGEIVEPFEEKGLPLSLHPTPIECRTPDVYRMFRKNFMDTIDLFSARHFSSLPSEALLKGYPPHLLNDLYNPACALYPELTNYAQRGYYFSGSGSAFFSLKELA